MPTRAIINGAHNRFVLNELSPTASPVFHTGYQGFGMWIVLLPIAQPCNTHIKHTGCHSHQVPLPQTPNGTLSSIQPFQVHIAIRSASVHMVVGIGVPSKYLDLPDSSLGRVCTVTLKRARRVRPQRTKKVRRRWSTGVRRPIANAAAAGATPKDTCKAKSVLSIVLDDGC